MARIFISYRRADSRLVTNRIYDRLKAAFGKKNIFKDVDNIPMGYDFRGVLREATSDCDVMLVIIGPNWLTVTDDEGNRRLDDPEDFVRLEIETGLQRDGTLVVPLLVEGASMPAASALPDSLKELAYNNAFVIHDDPMFHPNMDTLIRELKGRKKGYPWLTWIGSFLFVVIVMSISTYLRLNLSESPTLTPTPSDRAVVGDVTDTSVPRATASSRETDENPPTTPTLSSIGQLETLQAQQTQDAIAVEMTAALVTELAATDAAAYATLLALSATPTPPLTLTPVSTVTPEPTQALEALAFAGVSANADWTPVEREFDGVMMVLVPAGCFMMGSENGDANERPVAEVCIEEPFWLDKFEVTQGQFESNRGVKANEGAFDGNNRPVERITWFEANTYCQERRNSRLPTEAEWEFAARGPDGLIYPWGNDFEASYVIHTANSNNRTSDVGVDIRAEGKSWVDAYDMSGNVWEWMSSRVMVYPYNAADGREDLSASGERVTRGGSWFNPPYLLRTTYRISNPPDFWSYRFGFRCARDF